MLSIDDLVLEATQAVAITKHDLVQSLWSGYGEIRRYWIEGGSVDSVIVKHVKLPEQANHPRGWNNDISHQRKLKSYQIEINWYKRLAKRVSKDSRLPRLLYSEQHDSEMLMIMEDLDSVGFPLRKSSITIPEVKLCLKWLARFHATYLGIDSKDLWPIGTYWHLDTRPEELKVMENEELRLASSKIDEKLNSAQYQTIVHGDAKLANFCFSNTGNDVTAVDFQYVGKGCGIKDVAYFLSSCLESEECYQYENELLDYYFNCLSKGIQDNINQEDIDNLIVEWRGLYKYAWADFYRFLDGWSPGHWKMHDYSLNLTKQVLEEWN